jgi:Protein of unknown function (DUF2815)
MAETQVLKIKLENVRINRVSLAKPFQGKPDPSTGKLPDAKYHIDAIIGTDHAQLKPLQEVLRAAIVAKWKDEAPIMLQKIKANNKLPLHKGDIDRAGKPEYAGKLYLSANSADQPTIVVFDNGISIANRGTPEVLTPSHPKYPYSGCYADVILTFYGYSHPTGGQGVSAQLDGVMFRKHGEKLRGSSVVSVSEFTPPPAEDADEDAPPVANDASDGLL